MYHFSHARARTRVRVLGHALFLSLSLVHDAAGCTQYTYIVASRPYKSHPARVPAWLMDNGVWSGLAWHPCPRGRRRRRVSRYRPGPWGEGGKRVEGKGSPGSMDDAVLLLSMDLSVRIAVLVVVRCMVER